MWGKVPKTTKCPRGDCLHYECKPDAYPCLICTCNQHGAQYGRSFRYEHKEDQQCEKNFQRKPSMPDSST